MRKPDIGWLTAKEATSPSERIFQIGKRLTFVFWLAQIGLIIFFWRSLPPQVPLFFSRAWGEEQLVAKFGLFMLPFASLVVVLLNRLLTRLAPLEEPLIPQTLYVAVTIFNLLCLISLIQIIRLIA
jgi:hypothetical protein